MTGMTWGPDAVGPGTAARWGRWGPRPEDVLLAIASAVLALVSLTGRISPLGEFDEDWLLHFRGADGLGIGLVLLASAGLLLLRWRALVSLAIVDTCMFALHALGYLPPPLPAAELVVLYALATTRSIVVSALAASVTALSIVVADLLHDVSLDDDKLVAYLLAVVMACMVGYVVQVSRAQTRIAEENVRLLAEQQEARTHIAVREEKARLTRELHDIVAHGIGVMVALASAGRLAPGDRAHGAVQALAAVEDTGRAALVEMRTVMRDLHGTDGDSPPMLNDGALAALVERTRTAGLEVDLLVEGDPRPLPSEVDQAAFRVVQESLTNALRHSGAGHVRVRVGYRPEVIDIRVSDDGDGTRPRRRAEDRGRGHGHTGMRQRVEMLGGELGVRRTPEGFEVAATIPTGSRG